MGWVGPRGNAQPPFFCFLSPMYLEQRAVLAWQGGGEDYPWEEKSLKIIRCTHNHVPIALHLSRSTHRRQYMYLPTTQNKIIHRRNLVSSGTEAGTGKQLTSNPLHTPTTHRPVPPTHTRPPLPNKCPRNPETPARHQRRPRVPRTNRHTTPFSRVGWRGLASEVGSGVGGVMSWSDGRVLVSAST